MKHTKEELVYLMKFHQIDFVPVYYGNEYVGKVSDKLGYDTSHTSYRVSYDELIGLACETIDDYIEAVKKFKSDEKVVVEIDSYRDYKIEGTSEVEGTYDSIFEGFEYSNNRMRYCNGYYSRFKDKEVEKLYLMWTEWIPESRRMDLFYGGGVVD